MVPLNLQRRSDQAVARQSQVGASPVDRVRRDESVPIPLERVGPVEQRGDVRFEARAGLAKPSTSFDATSNTRGSAKANQPICVAKDLVPHSQRPHPGTGNPRETE